MYPRNLTIGLTLSFALLTSACAPLRSPAIVTVRNDAAETISELAVDVSGEHLSTTALGPGHAATLNYSIGAESDYHVIATFASGRRVEGRVGYVDSGLTSHDQLVVHADRVEFVPPQPRN